MPNNTCTVSGCDKKKVSSEYCGMHYARMLRTGALELAQPACVTSHGYRRTRAANREYEHRDVLMAVIGPEPHPCHWCNRMLVWGVDLEVDHVDENKLNNDPHNLVPACHQCNAGRSHWAKRMTSCKRGHPFTPENTRMRVRGDWTMRECRECVRVRDRNNKRRKAERTRAARQGGEAA